MTMQVPSLVHDLTKLPSPALVIGHFDSDGYLAAEQTRRNLRAARIKVSEVLISSETSNYRFWTGRFAKMSFGKFPLVVVVDIAFNFKNPKPSLASLLKVCRNNPSTQFVVIDHHPLLLPKNGPANLTLRSVERVYDCCLGEPSDEFMAVASICDGGIVVSSPRWRKRHLKRAQGLKRAAADKNIAGPRLQALLRQRRWSFFEALAEEPPEFHRTVRGRRIATNFPSPLLAALAMSSGTALSTSVLGLRR
ncbi:MAG: hypothetical protein GEU75_16730 [Dehalococcoidia bacterium]|nr:hypothetical protein [Dehalococcoidia bacterium]